MANLFFRKDVNTVRYRYLLFDADDTLFDFPKASSLAFAAMCARNDIPDARALYPRYHQINQELWAALDRGEVTKDFVVLERYRRLFRELGLERDPERCNRDYLEALGTMVFPLSHAEEVCRELRRRGHRMYLITNAVASVQRSRLAGSVFQGFFDGAFISEEAGAAKPDRAYFDYVRRCLPDLTADSALVIGDSLSADIRGANNAGLPCCWYNPGRTPRPEDLRIDCEISDLRQLLELV